MADGSINITVETDNEKIQGLIDRLNSATETTKMLTKDMRELRAEAVVGSKEQMQLKDIMTQVGEQTATANAKMMQSYFRLGEQIRAATVAGKSFITQAEKQVIVTNNSTVMNISQAESLKMVEAQLARLNISTDKNLVSGQSFTKLVKEQRQEQRLQTFVYMELVRSLDAFGIKNKEVLNVLSGGLQTYSGVSFALSAMGGKMAEFATPVGIVAAAMAALTTLIAGVTQKTKEYEIALKSLRDLQYKYALISNEEQRKGLQKNIDDAEKELADIEKKKELARERLAGRGLAAQLFNLGVEETKAEESRVKAVAALFDFLKEVSDLKNKEITQDKKNRDEFDKDIEKKNQEAIERNKWHVEQMAKDYKEGIDEQKKALEGQVADTQYAYQVGTIDAAQYKIKLLDLAKAFEEAGSPIQAVRMRRMADELKKYGTFAEQAAEKIRQLKRDSNLATSAIDAVQGVSQGLARQLGALAEGVQNIGQVWHEFGQIAIRALEQVIEKLIAAQIEAALLALIMAIATGGRSIAVGIGAPTVGNPFPGGVPSPIPLMDKGFSLSNAIIQSGRSGSSGAVIQPSVSVHPIINNQGLAVQVKIGNQQRSGRVG